MFCLSGNPDVPQPNISNGSILVGGRSGRDAMQILTRILLTILVFALLGFGIVGLIHGDPLIVLTNFTAVKHDAQLSLVISVCAGLVVSLLYN